MIIMDYGVIFIIFALLFFTVIMVTMGILERIFTPRKCDMCNKYIEELNEREKDHDRRREIKRSKRKQRKKHESPESQL